MMAHILPVMAGLLMLAGAQADGSMHQGFLSQYVGSALPHHNSPAKHGLSASGVEEKSVQKVVVSDSSMGFGMPAIGISLLTLAAMLGVRMRRGLQQATTFASSDGHESDMSTAFALDASDTILELKAQDARGYEESRIRGGWQQSSRNSEPLTLCYAKDSSGFDPLGLNMHEAEIQHGRTVTLATLFKSDPELKTKGFKNARFAAAATAFAPLAAFAGGQSEGTGLSLGIDDGREGTVILVIFGFFFLVYFNWAKEQPDSDSDFFAEYDERRL
jgi:hypothetical protein